MDSDSGRQAGAHQKGESGAELLGETIDSISRGLREIDERWHKRFVPNRHTVAEDYLGGRFALIFKLRIKAGAEGYCVAYAACHVDVEGVPILVAHDGEFGVAHLKQQPVVLIPIAQFIQNDNGLVPAFGFVSVTFYTVEKQPLRLLSGGTYRSLINGGFYALPIVRDGKSALGRIRPAVGANETHPTEIQGSSKVTADVSSHERELGWNGLSETDLKCVAAGLRVIFEGGNVRLGIEESATHIFDVLNVYCGPLDL